MQYLPFCKEEQPSSQERFLDLNLAKLSFYVRVPSNQMQLFYIGWLSHINRSKKVSLLHCLVAGLRHHFLYLFRRWHEQSAGLCCARAGFLCRLQSVSGHRSAAPRSRVMCWYAPRRSWRWCRKATRWHRRERSWIGCLEQSRHCLLHSPNGKKGNFAPLHQNTCRKSMTSFLSHEKSISLPFLFSLDELRALLHPLKRLQLEISILTSNMQRDHARY